MKSGLIAHGRRVSERSSKLSEMSADRAMMEHIVRIVVAIFRRMQRINYGRCM